MSVLVAHELFTDKELIQNFEFKNNVRQIIGSFVPYLYMHNAPGGTFTLTISNDAGVVASKDFTCQDIKTSLNTTFNYARIWFPIIPTNPVMMEKGAFSVKLSAINYEYRSNSFIGWIQPHENLVNEMDFAPLNDGENPLALKLKVLKDGILCRN